MSLTTLPNLQLSASAGLGRGFDLTLEACLLRTTSGGAVVYYELNGSLAVAGRATWVFDAGSSASQ